jgi:hypothetical protein
MLVLNVLWEGVRVLRDVTVMLCGRELRFWVLMDANAMFC